MNQFQLRGNKLHPTSPLFMLYVSMTRPHETWPSLCRCCDSEALSRIYLKCPHSEERSNHGKEESKYLKPS